MTDRELIEAAAKAAGYTSHGYGELVGNSPCLWLREADFTGMWAPLTDDGDALRLMSRLNINVSYRENINGAWVVAEHEGIDFCPESLDGPHENDATRRAIVRAAASIGAAIGGVK